MSDTLPKGWKWVKLGEVAEIKGGKRLPKGILLTTKKTPYPYIRITDFKGHKIDLSNIMYVDEDTRKVISKYTVNKQDIILSIVGTFGLCAIVPNELDNANLTENCVKFVFDKTKIDTNFLYYHLISPDTQELIKSLDVGSTQPKLPIYNIQKIDILLPPLHDQKAIAEVLSSIDDKIDLLHRQNKTLEEMAITLFRQWFIEPAKDGLPEGWKMGYLADEFDITMGQSPPGETLNEEKIGMVFFQGGSDFRFRFPVPRVYTTAPTRIAKPLDTLVSVRAPVGDINMAFEECCLGRGVAAFRYKQNPEFYSYTYYKMRSLTEQIKLFEDYGTVFGSIGKENFKKLDCFIPPIEMILKFEENAKPFDDKIISNTSQIQTLEKLRDILLPKLMSGEVRIMNRK